MTAMESGNCPYCGGNREAGQTTFSLELGFGIIVVRHVPATVCVQCGADWIDDAVAARLEGYVEDAQRKHSQVEIVAFA